MPHITNLGAGGSLSDKSMITHLHKAAKPHGDPTENRTPVSSVRGSRPRPLDDGAIKRGDFVFCPRGATPAGFQPTTPLINSTTLSSSTTSCREL